MTPGMFADEAALRAYARKLQHLHIRLLFCSRTRTAWRTSPEAVLAQEALPPTARHYFPDIDSDRFRAEVHGRRALVERSVKRTFARTTPLLDRTSAITGWDGTVPVFDDFLCSPYFFDPRRSLPHPTGVGPGYENFSKYFFWLRDVLGLVRPGVDAELRTAVYLDFAIYLLKEYARPHIPYYDRFKGGLQWRRLPGVPLPVILITEDGTTVVVGNRDTAAGLHRIGLIDLDGLQPPSARDESAAI